MKRFAGTISHQQFITQVRRDYLLDILRQASGNQCKAAEIAGVHRNTINRMIDECNIKRSEIREIRMSSRRNHNV